MAGSGAAKRTRSGSVPGSRPTNPRDNQYARGDRPESAVLDPTAPKAVPDRRPTLRRTPNPPIPTIHEISGLGPFRCQGAVRRPPSQSSSLSRPTCANTRPDPQSPENVVPTTGAARALSDQIESNLMVANRLPGQARIEARCWAIGRVPQRTRDADLPHRRTGFFAPWRRCTSLPMPHLAMRIAPTHGAK